MRHMFNLIAIASLMLCIIVLADRWDRRGRSDWCSALMWHTSGGVSVNRELGISSRQGVIVIGLYTSARDAGHSAAPVSHTNYGTLPELVPFVPMHDTPLGRAGFAVKIRRTAVRHGVTPWSLSREAMIPSWFAALLFAVLPVAWLRHRIQRRRRIARGLCTVCGYDLRASTGRCPECGAALASGATRATSI